MIAYLLAAGLLPLLCWMEDRGVYVLRGPERVVPTVRVEVDEERSRHARTRPLNHSPSPPMMAD